ncbi:MAG: inositol monophosphatase [Dehalococcoidia bacterium]|nr:inositol monophosphatase [Dehalococcoidia bacterium]
MPRFRNLASADIREKSAPGDLVTVADEAMELRLATALRDLLPGSVVIGEEAAAADPAVHDLIAGDDPVWVVDPLDGTSNFVAGRAAFGVIVALVVRGETRMGWIHDLNAGHTATAECGSGAWLNSKRLAVMVPASTAALRGVMATKFFPASLREQLNARRSLFKRHRQSHAAGDYVELVRGTLDFSLYQRTLPWDHAAGVLLYAEAGGYSARLDGTAYRPVHRDGGLLAAPDRAVWDYLYHELFQRAD